MSKEKDVAQTTADKEVVQSQETQKKSRKEENMRMLKFFLFSCI